MTVQDEPTPDGDGLGAELAVIADAVERFQDIEGELVDAAIELAMVPWTGISETTTLRLLHTQPFFQATRHLEAESSQPAPRPRSARPNEALRPRPLQQPEHGTVVAEEEELEAELEWVRTEVAPLAAMAAPYAAAPNTPAGDFQRDVWSHLLTALVEAFGGVAAVLQLFGLEDAQLDAVTAAWLAEAIAGDPGTVAAWSILDWLLFEDPAVFRDMLPSFKDDALDEEG
jgi:hypothetical protein